MDGGGGGVGGPVRPGGAGDAAGPVVCRLRRSVAGVALGAVLVAERSARARGDRAADGRVQGRRLRRRLPAQPDRAVDGIPRSGLVDGHGCRRARGRAPGHRGLVLRRGQVAQRFRRRDRAAGQRGLPRARPPATPRGRPVAAGCRGAGAGRDPPLRVLEGAHGRCVVQRNLLGRPDESGDGAGVHRLQLPALRRTLRAADGLRGARHLHRRAPGVAARRRGA